MKIGFNLPTPIQRKTIPLILSGRDVVAMVITIFFSFQKLILFKARTGSGKTAAFLIPMLEKFKSHSKKMGARGLILSPTRDLAMQTFKVLKKLSAFTDLRFCLIVGGDSMDAQYTDLSNFPDIIVATPGRLLHHVVQINYPLSSISYIVFDEADRLFEMGFAEQIKEILKSVSTERQTSLFSATMPKQLFEFSKAGLHNPVLVRLDTELKIPELLRIQFFHVRNDLVYKLACLLFLLKHIIFQKKAENQKTIIFVATKHHVELVNAVLNKSGVDSACLYSKMDPTARRINVAKFSKHGTTDENQEEEEKKEEAKENVVGDITRRVLVTTDVAARGIDVPLLDNVINFDFPATSKLFVHRVGRAARNGREGYAYNFTTTEELPYMVDLFNFLGKDILNEVEENNASQPENQGYEKNIYYGTIPDESVDNQNEILESYFKYTTDLQELKKSSENGLILYKKTRTLPSKKSIKAAKTIVESGIKIHPMFYQQYDQDLKGRYQFVTQLSKFRPAQTIFEYKKDDDEGSLIMKNKRIFHKTKQDIEKRKLLYRLYQTSHSEKEDHLPQNEEENLEGDEKSSSNTESQSQIVKKRKPRQKKKKEEKNYKDDKFFIPFYPSDKEAEDGYSINSKPHQEDKSARDYIMDMLPDEAQDILEKRRYTKVWDRKKKKFIGVNESTPSLKLKNESGKLIKKTDKDKSFAEWQKKTKQMIPVVCQLEQEGS